MNSIYVLKKANNWWLRCKNYRPIQAVILISASLLLLSLFLVIASNLFGLLIATLSAFLILERVFGFSLQPSVFTHV